MQVTIGVTTVEGHRSTPPAGGLDFWADKEDAMRFLRRLFKRSHSWTGKLTERGYHQLPGSFQSPTPRVPVDKDEWQACDACGRQIPVVADWVMLPNGTRSRARTYTYVCPFCSCCHVGTPMRWNKDLVAQEKCHACGARLSDKCQCPKCGYPRGWMRVGCPYCGNQQPVFAPHFVVFCDTFTLECVECESMFRSLCIC